MNRPKLAAALAAAILLISTRPGLAASWDLIYTDHIDVTLCSNGCGITLAGEDFALLVNTGTEDISVAEFKAATFEVTSSIPGISLQVFVTDPSPLVAPIHPGQAIGGVTSTDEAVTGRNDVLLTRLLPSESHLNTFGLQVLPFEIQRLASDDTYEGPVHFDVRMILGGQVALFAIDADMHLGDFRLLFPSAARVRSVPLSTPVGDVSWGRVKSLYR